MENNSSHNSSDAVKDTDQEQHGVIELADSIFKECLADSIYLLGQGAHAYVHQDGPQNSNCLELLAAALLRRFTHTGQWEDVQDAGVVCVAEVIPGGDTRLQCLRTAAALKMDTLDIDDNPADIVALANSMLADFGQSVNLSNLHTAILLYQEAGEDQEISGREKTKILRQLSMAHLIAFHVAGQVEEQDKSISLLQNLCLEQPKYLSCLCATLLSGNNSTRILQALTLLSEAQKLDGQALDLAHTGIHNFKLFQQSQQDSILDMAISMMEGATSKLPWGHSEYGELMTNMGVVIHERFRRRGETADLDSIIEIYLEALELSKDPNEGRRVCLNNLACALHDQFNRRGKLNDLDCAIARQQEGVDLFSPPEPDQLSCLANWLHERFEIMGEGDLNTVINLHREALDLFTSADPNRLSSLIGLTDALQKRFQALRDLADLDDYIRLNRQVSGICSDTNPNRGPCLNNLANALLKRFQTLHEGADLDEAISHHREALALFPAPHPNHGMSLMNLAQALEEQFETTGVLSDLNTCIDISYEALLFLHSEQDSSMNNLANLLCKRFKLTGAIADLNAAIDMYDQVLMLRPPSHPDRGVSLINLATAMSERFEASHEITALEHSIKLYHEGLDMFSASHPHRLNCLGGLAKVLYIRYERTGSPADLATVIDLRREALDLHPNPGTERAEILNDLAQAFLERFQSTSADLVDVDNAIKLVGEALGIISNPHPRRPTLLSNLAAAMGARFKMCGTPADLVNISLLHQEALDLYPEGDPGRGLTLNGLADVHKNRFEIYGSPGDLDSAVMLLQEAVGLERGDMADLDRAIGLSREALDVFHGPGAVTLYNLATLLQMRFRYRHEEADLEGAISLLNKAIDLHPPPHIFRRQSLMGLGEVQLGTIKTRLFGTRGKVECQGRGMPSGNLRNSFYVNQGPNEEIGTSRICQINDFSETDPKILRKAKRNRKNIVKITNRLLLVWAAKWAKRGTHNSVQPAQNIEKNNGSWEKLRRQLPDLESAITLYREALDITAAPTGTSVERVMMLSRLAHALLARFTERGNLEDLDDGIRLNSEALDLQPFPHPSSGATLQNLAIGLRNRFTAKGDIADLDRGLELYQQVLNIYEAPHPQRAACLRNFGIALILKSQKGSSEPMLMEEGVEAFREASAYMSSSPFDRFEMSAEWARIAGTVNHNSALEAYDSAIQLLPHLAMIGMDLQSRQNVLRLERNRGLASDAAACALQLKHVEKAVEFLEAGRAVLWSQALQLQTSLDDLRVDHPDLAERLSDILEKFKHGSHRDVASTRILPPELKAEHNMIDKEDAYYRGLNSSWAQVLKETQQLPGFEGFLRPKLWAELRMVSTNGPIVILNPGRFGCTAFIVSSEDVRTEPLLWFNWQTAEFLVQLLKAARNDSAVQISQLLAKIDRNTSTDLSRLQQRLFGQMEAEKQYNPNKVFGKLLGTLWTMIVFPILRRLHLKKTDEPGRLWWCPIGPLAFLPIHAAGFYGDLGANCVSDYVVSSYTPTLTALLDAPTESMTPIKMTTLIQPTTPGSASLPATREELRKIKEQVPSQWLTSLGDGLEPSTIKNALNHLRESSIAHFARHGTQDLRNPLDSGLLLNDGRLKVSDLVRGGDNVMTRRKKMTLAFLSACETATGDETVPDEAMHLAAALLVAGFRGVVGTMWTMVDADGPKVAEAFYEHLFKGCDATVDPPVLPDLTKAAEALHIAVGKLRSDPNVSFARWVPFVHYGL
ncbi:CHAT domain-containing protein [Mycena maculata]|uniref:CHAT domain-containing protein n=1 Tax=Mycena maculata TaxID=230809 RepID=A0AAD7MJQ7_9AGAR|nr:CHAT domain-containing protein [Mycena maculata]